MEAWAVRCPPSFSAPCLSLFCSTTTTNLPRARSGSGHCMARAPRVCFVCFVCFVFFLGSLYDNNSPQAPSNPRTPRARAATPIVCGRPARRAGERRACLPLFGVRCLLLSLTADPVFAWGHSARTPPPPRAKRAAARGACALLPHTLQACPPSFFHLFSSIKTIHPFNKTPAVLRVTRMRVGAAAPGFLTFLPPSFYAPFFLLKKFHFLFD
jgi:hypothetical protein